MKYRTRTFYTAQQRALMWEHYSRGESVESIARLFDRGHSSIGGILGKTGGIRPPDRTRAEQSLSLSEREEISRGLVAQLSFRAIAAQLDRSPSTISREVNRNGGRKSYRATQADNTAWTRAKRPKICKLLENKTLAQLVARKLKQDWSPQQIAGWLKRTYRHDQEYYVSHETIYRTLYIQTRGALKKELIQHLRSHRVMRRSRKASLKGKGHGKIPDAVAISERPPEVKDRSIPGHWEGDLIQGSGKTFIATLVERHSRLVMLVKVSDNKTTTVVNALIKQSKKLPSELYKSLTWDRGPEMTNHRQFTVATDIKVYLCDPHSPWQRGSNENTNRLLRQYLPKGTDISKHTQAQLNQIARRLNERPRKTLNYETPADRFNSSVALID